MRGGSNARGGSRRATARAVAQCACLSGGPLDASELNTNSGENRLGEVAGSRIYGPMSGHVPDSAWRPSGSRPRFFSAAACRALASTLSIVTGAPPWRLLSSAASMKA